jgi:hypothetical protein
LPNRSRRCQELKSALPQPPHGLSYVPASSHTCHNLLKNVLPDNVASLSIALFLALNVSYLFSPTPLSILTPFALADRAGLYFVDNLPVLYILSARNSQPIKWLTGSSYEGLNIFHCWLGKWMVILAFIYTIGMFGV